VQSGKEHQVGRDGILACDSAAFPPQVRRITKSRQLHTIVSDNNISQKTTQVDSLFWLQMCTYPVHCLRSRRSLHLHQERIEPVHQNEKAVHQRSDINCDKFALLVARVHRRDRRPCEEASSSLGRKFHRPCNEDAPNRPIRTQEAITLRADSRR